MTALFLARQPPALTALEKYPLLHSSVESGLAGQIASVIASANSFIGRRTFLAQLNNLFAESPGGLIALEGPPGSGVSTLLRYLAATQPAAFWFGESDADQGAAALCAQLIALHQLAIPLVPPSANDDPKALEQLLGEVAAHCQANKQRPLVLIDPSPDPHQPFRPLPPPLPLQLPEGVLVVYGCTPDATLSWKPHTRIQIPLSGSEVTYDQALQLQRWRCQADWLKPLITAAQGNWLYLRLALRLLRANLLDIRALPSSLDQLHDIWWSTLDSSGQRLALLLAAGGEAIPLTVCAELSGGDPLPHLRTWATLGIVVPKTQAAEQPSAGGGTQCCTFWHWVTRDYLARHHKTRLAQTHAACVTYALRQGAASNDSRHKGVAPSRAASRQIQTYLVQRFARHAALGGRTTQMTALPLVTRRAWALAHERRSGQFSDAAQDLVWELQLVARVDGGGDQALLRLARSAALAGTLVSRARMLAPSVALAALSSALEQRGREAGLKRVLDLVEQLPDGRDKALILRQLGEACYEARMRSSAMRLLSRALDLEEQPFPRAWREQREQLHAALSHAALEQGAVAAAREISARISHAERRGMAETQIVRWLLDQGSSGSDGALMAQARELACHITHESMGAWARSEVAVALAREGDLAAAEDLLASVEIETANAWAQIELACDTTVERADAARARIDRLYSPNQRDRGLAHLSHALALADKDGDALAAAEQIGDVEVRVSALLDLRLTLDGLVAMLALERATAEIGALKGDARAPLLSALAAAHAALGRRERALSIANQLEEGEERDRALSRMAVAFAQQGDHEQGQLIARALDDDDERDWTFDELTRLLGQAGRWQAAQGLANEIVAADQKARTLAELAIARARADSPLAAFELAGSICAPSERSRALNIIAPQLIAAGQLATALSIIEEEGKSTQPLFATVEARSRYTAAIAMTLAECGDFQQAQRLASAQLRSLDRARVYLAIALTNARRQDREPAYAALGAALLVAAQGRDEAFRVLEQATSVFALLGGAETLTNIAAAIDEIDNW
jgi:hypothetical protein